MELPALDMLLFLIGMGFVAGFIDASVGGGGLISVPALLLTGLPPNMVLGTNKLGGTLSSLTSTASFLASGKVSGKLVIILFPLSFVGSALGTYTVHLLPSDFLRPIVVGLLIVVLIYSLMKKQWDGTGAGVTFNWSRKLAAGVCALVLGYYDGFFGPGTGSFLMFFFLLLGFDFVRATANAKVLNLASNLASLGSFFLFKSVNIGYGLPMGLSMIFGALAGSQFAIRRGSRYVKPLFIIVTTVLIGKQLWDLWRP
ncbi:TSUP family transporter [Paenibacillus filicis]|uniref:Probable membrane transporter protein n=1 Tax=Paenibacillus gyeongsangnamensis TaxID=3388067 RepID=A0ABT4QF74_9BACL|nr:TSUP family transporter [Paenibacillus filicis]MCZ8515532.1 TSUP family transporter [Paenibacillus filicis]